ncbi:ATPase, AAA family protein [Tritrichomonas foetus]|uniref:ATPase, AAA family protein n=1 Tax=Tritrichomonas foetus TaxID=1144522 RepID=A0A1J4K9T2_9EUKA|nr:ATPase, AAA family protein [Tritrichomonas foetus]|eukprot:OHT08183.1 ATPase, AAA family protein [Tritrichomonas foetus]
MGDFCSIGYFTADALEIKWGSLAVVRDRAGNFYSCELYPDNQVFAESSTNLSCFELPPIPLVKSRQYAELPDGTFVSIIKDNEIVSSSQMTATLLNTSIEQPEWTFVEKQLNSFLRGHPVPLANGTKISFNLLTNQIIQLQVENKSTLPKFFKITPTTKITFVHNHHSTNLIEYPSFVELTEKLNKYINYSIYNSAKPPKLVGFQGFMKSSTTTTNNNSKKNLPNYHPKGVMIAGANGSGRGTLVRNSADKLNLRFHEIDADKFNSTQLTYPELMVKISPKTVVLLRNFDNIVSGESTSFQKRVLTHLTNLIDKSHEVFFAMTVLSMESIPTTLQTAKRLSYSIVVPPLSNNDIRCILPPTFSKSAFTIASGLPTSALINARESNNENELFDSLSSSEGSQIRSSIAETKWSDIGGLSSTKVAVREAVEWPLTRSNELKQFGIQPPKGVLLYGPPGCGKTMIARAIATSLSSSFFAISAASVFQMYLGESERIVRELFALARQKSPAVIFIDEIDAMVGKRGKVTGVSERVLSTFLNEMDGVNSLNDVVVVAATNRKDALDEALCRPGRFDCLIEVKPCSCEEDVKEVLDVCTRKMPIDDDVLENASKLIKIGTSGAEIDNICREAALLALNRGEETISLNCFETIIGKYQNT